MKEMIISALLAIAICIGLSPIVIPALRKLKFGQTEREDGPQSHLVKSGTPTMGGIMILIAILVATVMTVLLSTGSLEFALPALLVTFAYSLVGFLDDFIKVKKKRSLGLKAYQKIIGQFAIALVLALYAYNNPYIGSKIHLAFFNVEWDLGIWYIPFAMFVAIGTTNSVNLTDGLDGLASGVTLIYSVSLAVIFSMMSGAAQAAGQVLYGDNLDGMAIFSAAVAGGCIGFLKSNAYPAKVFMGDTGSLALGGAVTVMALFSRAVLLLPIMGACFVASAVSVILQVGSFKLRGGKRIFKMAPLHHHFELLGVPETRIVAMYMIITTVLCLICLIAFA